MKKRTKTILIVSFIALIIIGLFSSGILNTIVGVSNELDYKTKWSNQDLTKGNYETEAILNLPQGTSLFSFTPDYSFRTYNKDSTNVKVGVIYQIFNYKTNNYEVLHNKDINLRNDYGEQNDFSMGGETVYNTGIPERFDSMRTGRKSYNRYFGCLEGMTIQEAKELNPWAEGTSSYSYNCIYPKNQLVQHEYNDDSNEGWDIKYFPELITKNSDYINNSKALFKISVNVKSSGIDKIDNKDFRINLWELITPVIDTYSFDGINCNYQAKYSYQTIESDFFTKKECEFSNGLIGCYLDEQCSTDKEGYLAECEEDTCKERKETIIDKIFPDKDEPEEDDDVEKQKINPLNLILPLIILSLLIFIGFKLIRRKN